MAATHRPLVYTEILYARATREQVAAVAAEARRRGIKPGTLVREAVLAELKRGGIAQQRRAGSERARVQA